ncbi:unnamed protein product [Phyllotreta striolata]|uniref:BSD domain-containing protein n=1 Tax=Phyllotreta striolata TaxID=444603 RepID=A0A9N9TR73_PHYSR|nr:unnamed protein product [Phyllotreta striolata]
MAEKVENNWFGSWLNAAKNKGSEVLEFVKKDLEEFGSAVKSEATNVVSSTGAVLEKTLSLDSQSSAASSMKRSFSSFLGQMNTILNPSPDDSDTEILIVENSETKTLNEFQKCLYNLQNDPGTFLEDPDESLSGQYKCWLEIMEDRLSEERIGKCVNSSEILRNQYDKLVPGDVEHDVFWKRYLFKKALLEDELARREAMEKREQKEKLQKEENLKWEQEDFSTDIELTEEQQIKLLEQYEMERKTNNKTDKKSPEKLPKSTKKQSKNVEKNVEKLPKNESNASLRSTPSTSGSSSDGDWEKIGEEK